MGSIKNLDTTVKSVHYKKRKFSSQIASL